MRAVTIAALLATLLVSLGSALWAVDQGPEMASVEGEHIILKLRAEDMKKLDDPKAWVEKLDRIYEAYADLVGDTPFNGEKTTVLSVEDPPGGWAVAGNPILWHRPCAEEVLDQINQGDWLFGIMHEIGHNFDLDYRWVWDPEFWANFKMVYALEQTKGIAFMGDKIYDPSKDQPIYDYYHAHTVKVGMLDYMTDGGNDGDSEQDKFAQIVKDVGWGPFKRTFRAYMKLDPKILPQDPIGKRSLFLRILEEQAGKKLLPRFVDWGFTVFESPTRDIETFAQELKARDWAVALDPRIINASMDSKVPIEVEVSVPKVTTFKKGLGTHADSEIVYNLDGQYEKFETYFGVTGLDNARELLGSVIFEIVADGKTLYKSPIMRGSSICRRAQIDATGVKELTLIADSADNGGYNDHAGWGDTKVIDAEGNVTYLSDMTPVKVKQTFGELILDKSIDEGPMLFGRGPASRQTDVKAMYGEPTSGESRKQVSLMQPPRRAGIYTCTLDPMPKGMNQVWLTVQPDGCPLILHEMIFVAVK